MKQLHMSLLALAAAATVAPAAQAQTEFDARCRVLQRMDASRAAVGRQFDFALQLGPTPYEICETMERAVAPAAAEAEAGEVVLVAPAAASRSDV